MRASPCYRSGFCCKQAPCQFGEPMSEDDPSCVHLEVLERPEDGVVIHGCGIHDEIRGEPGEDLDPAFGAGCCSPLFNDQRNRNAAWITARKEDDVPSKESNAPRRQAVLPGADEYGVAQETRDPNMRNMGLGKLKGLTILSAGFIPDRDFGSLPVIVVDCGGQPTAFPIMCDPEGNGPGWIHGLREL